VRPTIASPLVSHLPPRNADQKKNLFVKRIWAMRIARLYDN